MLTTWLWTDLKVNVTVLYISAFTCSKGWLYCNIKPLSASLWQQNTVLTDRVALDSLGFWIWICKHLIIFMWIQVSAEAGKKRESTSEWDPDGLSGCHVRGRLYSIMVTETLGNMLLFVNNCENKHGCWDALWSIPKWLMTKASDCISVEPSHCKNIKHCFLGGDFIQWKKASSWEANEDHVGCDKGNRSCTQN